MNDTLLDSTSITDSSVPEAPPVAEVSRATRILKTVGWVCFGVFCLMLFTLLKLPPET